MEKHNEICIHITGINFILSVVATALYYRPTPTGEFIQLATHNLREIKEILIQESSKFLISGFNNIGHSRPNLYMYSAEQAYSY